MTEQEKELLCYLKSTWLRIRFGIAILVGSIVALWLFCWIIVQIRN